MNHDLNQAATILGLKEAALILSGIGKDIANPRTKAKLLEVIKCVVSAIDLLEKRG